MKTTKFSKTRIICNGLTLCMIMFFLFTGQQEGCCPDCPNVIGHTACPGGCSIHIDFFLPPDCTSTVPSNATSSATDYSDFVMTPSGNTYTEFATSTGTGPSMDMKVDCDGMCQYAKIIVKIPNDPNCGSGHTGIYKGTMSATGPIACTGTYPMCLEFVRCQ